MVQLDVLAEDKTTGVGGEQSLDVFWVRHLVPNAALITHEN